MVTKADIHEKIIKRWRVYKTRKDLGLKLYELILYDTVYFLSKRRRTLLGRKIWNSNARRVAFSNYGLKFTENSNINEVIFDRSYTRHNLFLPSEEDIVVDVGAQDGDYAVLCSKFYRAKVYAFEPLFDNFKTIQKNIKLNQLQINRIKAFNIALGDKRVTKEITFYKDMANNTGKGHKIKIKFRTLDSYKLNPTILKVDVEGFEMDVLNGAIETISKYKPKIIVETHSSILEKSVLRFLSKFGYSLMYKSKSWYGAANPEFNKVTNLFLSTKTN